MKVKTLPVSEELHALIKRRAQNEGRQIRVVVAMAFRRLFGEAEFKECAEYELLPIKDRK